jgi:predicted phage terminase large subunit-like protein
MYIHSSYLDADRSLIPANILADYLRLKETDPKEYENIVMGGWVTELEGQIFPEKSLKRYREFPENTEYFTVAYADTADEGMDNFAMPIARVYGNRVYVFDCIFDQDNLTIQEAQVQNKVKICHIDNLVIETNNAGAYFTRRIRELIPYIEVFGLYSKANKMARIIGYSGMIKYYFYFPENPNDDLQKFMTQVINILKDSKELDDAPDSLAGLCSHLEKYHSLFKET